MSGKEWHHRVILLNKIHFPFKKKKKLSANITGSSSQWNPHSSLPPGGRSQGLVQSYHILHSSLSPKSPNIWSAKLPYGAVNYKAHSHLIFLPLSYTNRKRRSSLHYSLLLLLTTVFLKPERAWPIRVWK